MANVRTYARSFGGGEVSPDMFGRIDDGKYQTGLAECVNFFVRPQGAIENRCGTHFVRQAKLNATRKCRLIPFVFNNTQTMVLEVGHLYMRFHTLLATLMNGAAPYEIVTPFDESILFELHYVQSADVMTFVHPTIAPQELRRLGALNWTITPVAFTSPAAPTGVSATATVADSLPPNIDYSYMVTWIRDSDGAESQPSASATCVNNLYITGNLNTITWSAVAGAREYMVYKLQGGLHGYIGRTSGASFVDQNIAADMSRTPPIADTTLVTNNPGAVSYYEQRRVFAGATNLPQNVWMTKSGTETELSYSLPVRDDDRISFRIAAREVEMVRHIVPLDNLLLLTGAGEWRVSSSGGGAITPATVSVKPQSYIGSNKAQPLVVARSALFAGARGGHLYEMGYNWQANGYITGDLSLRNAWRFDGRDIVDMAYSKAPYPVAWVVSSNGNLLGLTYVPEQQIGAWHVHQTYRGAFESVCVVPEGPTDAVYVVVKRGIGLGTYRCIERLAWRAMQHEDVMPAESYFVDCGKTYESPPGTTMTGLDHLEGEKVNIIADGIPLPQQYVSGGQVTIPKAASLVSVGLPIDAHIKTLPVAAAIDNAYGQGRAKNVNKVMLKLHRSGSSFQAGPSLDRLRAQRQPQHIGAAATLFTGEFELRLEGDWTDGGGQFYVKQVDPLPLTILGMTAEVAVGG